MAVEVTLLQDEINCQIVQVSGRRYPGVVVQGDSLSNLVDLASEIVRLLDTKDIDEAKDAAQELHGLLFARLEVYKDALNRKEQSEN